MGFAEAVSGFARAVGGNRVERFCRELGWSVDEREGRSIGLYFKCPVAGRRTVYIIGGDDPIVLFGTYSRASFSTQRLPSDAASFALVHNQKCALGKWEIDVDDDEAKFRLTYNALTAGLTAGFFKEICSEFVEAAGTFDKWMIKEGYLR